MSGLDEFLNLATKELENFPQNKCNSQRKETAEEETELEHFLQEINIFRTEESSDIDSKETRNSKKLQTKKNSLARTKEKNVNLKNSTENIVHNGDTDSSDDEDNRYFESSKLSECGKSIKHLLSTTNSYTDSRGNSFQKQNAKEYSDLKNSLKFCDSTNTNSKELQLPRKEELVKNDVYMDPIFGIRIINPLVSSTMLQERMNGRKAVSIANLKFYIRNLKPDEDWVIAGVIIRKTNSKVTSKGNPFSIWTLSDLKGEIKTVGLFLFGSAHKNLWKTCPGTVVGILNPSVLEEKSGTKDEATLSINNSQKVMVLGQSKDLGTCRSTIKDGSKCTAIVNKTTCEFCMYHIKKEYKKCSNGRSEIQSNFGGRGLVELRNKVLGKNEVFYAGKSYMAIPLKKNNKQTKRDAQRLHMLNSNNLIVNNNVQMKIKNLEMTNTSLQKKKGAAVMLDSCKNQRSKDLELLRKLSGIPANLNKELSEGERNNEDLINKRNIEDLIPQSTSVSLEESKSTALTVISKLKEKRKELDKDDPKNKRQIVNLKQLDKVDNINLITQSSESNLKIVENEKTSKLPIENFQNQISKEVEMNNKAKKLNKTNVNVATNKLNITFPSSTPKLSTPSNGEIDLNIPITRRQVDKAKFNALMWVKKNGPIKKSDPMNTKGRGVKRTLDNIELENDTKKQKTIANGFQSERFKKIMAACSNHMDLVEQHDFEEKEKYFQLLEKKEQMEDKMLNTFKVDCKAVKCLKCKYTSFSASDFCKKEKHPLKVFDAIKRFFKCSDCGNRTCCLELVPIRECKNCGGSRWEKAAMMKEKIINKAHTLSIRGGEQKFVNSVVCNGNLNLLVPDN